MKSLFVSSAAVSQAMRYSMARAQSELTKAQKEMTTGVVADVGLALGARAGQSVSLARDLDRLKGIVDTNGLITARLTATQNSLTQIATAANGFLSTLTTNATPSVVLNEARSTLDALTSALNTSYNGEHLFAGVNTDVQPINDFFAAGSPNKAAFDAGFQSFFGFTQNDAAAASITADQMNDFVDTVLVPQFLGSGWQGTWSNAADDGITSRIALNETAVTSVSANQTGLRRLAMSAAAVAAIFDSNVGEAGRKALVDRTLGEVGIAMSEVANIKANTGTIENRVKNASDRIGMQSDLFEESLLKLEGVDPYEASTRVTMLLQQIETSYALTARIQQLSLVNFLS